MVIVTKKEKKKRRKLCGSKITVTQLQYLHIRRRLLPRTTQASADATMYSQPRPDQRVTLKTLAACQPDLDEGLISCTSSPVVQGGWDKHRPVS